MDAFEILVIILSVALAVFLVLSIVAVSLTIKLVQTLRQIVAKGEQLVDSAGEITEALRRNAGAAGIIRTLVGFVSNLNGSNKGKDKEE